MRFGTRLFVVGTLALASLAACSSTVVTTTSDGGDEDAAVPVDATTPARDASTSQDAGVRDSATPRDSAPPPPDAAVDAADAAKDTGSDAAVTACYAPDDALALTAAAPRLSPSLCTAAQIVGAQTACLGPAATSATCNNYLAANRSCARCIFGALAGDTPATTPLGSLIPVSEDSVAPAIGGCAALIIGRPECAVPVSQQTVCTSSACATCMDAASEEACLGTASLGICAGLGDGACNAAIDATVATWGPRCRGAAFNDTYLKVATVMCGAP